MATKQQSARSRSRSRVRHALQNNCSCSEITVSPENWDRAGASIKKDWYIAYRFYDPEHTDRYPKGKQVVNKGMNEFKTLADRRKVTTALLAAIREKVLEEGWNPITERYMLDRPGAESTPDYIIDPQTPFPLALQKAYELKECSAGTKKDIRSVLRYSLTAIQQLRLSDKPICEVKRVHVRMVLDQVGKAKGDKWTGNNYNFYRSHLSMLFMELVHVDAMETDPTADIKKADVVREKKQVLTDWERRLVNEALYKYDRALWRFLHIFYTTGARTAELLRVRLEDVDLRRQVVRSLIVKGRRPHWVERTIPDSMVSMWREAMQGAKPGDYLFGRGLIPAPVGIRPEQITRRWKRHVKDKLGITADWNSNRHLSTTEAVTLMGEEVAAKRAGHTSTQMVKKTYDVLQDARMHKKVKGINLSFVPSNMVQDHDAEIQALKKRLAELEGITKN